MKPITKEYFRKFGVLIPIAIFAWMYYYPSLKYYSYILLIMALLIYLFAPKTKIPQGAAYYSKILVLDIIGYAYWMGTTLFFFFIVIDESDSVSRAIFFFIVFAIFPLYLIRHSVKPSSRWYLFTENTFRWSDTEGIQSVRLNDIESAEPYVKKKYPFAPAEMGIVITTKSGKKIRMMSNNLETNGIFMNHLQELYLAGDDTFAQYLKDGTYTEGDETFNQNLKELQKKMEETG